MPRWPEGEFAIYRVSIHRVNANGTSQTVHALRRLLPAALRQAEKLAAMYGGTATIERTVVSENAWEKVNANGMDTPGG